MVSVLSEIGFAGPCLLDTGNNGNRQPERPCRAHTYTIDNDLIQVSWFEALPLPLAPRLTDTLSPRDPGLQDSHWPSLYGPRLCSVIPPVAIGVFDGQIPIFSEELCELRVMLLEAIWFNDLLLRGEVALSEGVEAPALRAVPWTLYAVKHSYRSVLQSEKKSQKSHHISSDPFPS